MTWSAAFTYLEPVVSGFYAACFESKKDLEEEKGNGDTQEKKNSSNFRVIFPFPFQKTSTLFFSLVLGRLHSKQKHQNKDNMPMFQQYDSLVAETYSACGKLALDMDLLPLAFQFLSKALDRNPIHIVTLLLLCDGYKKDTATVAQNHTRVVELLVNSINSNSEIARDYRIWKELALSYAKLNIPHDALNSISQALTMEPARDSSLWVIQSRICLLYTSRCV